MYGSRGTARFFVLSATASRGAAGVYSLSERRRRRQLPRRRLGCSRAPRCQRCGAGGLARLVSPLLKQLARETANRRRFATRRYKLPFICSSAPLIACPRQCLSTRLCYGEYRPVSKLASRVAEAKSTRPKLQEPLAKVPKHASWLRGSPPRPKLGFGEASGGKTLASGAAELTRCYRSRQ